MVDNIHDRVVTSNSPSKIRGGGARATGALKITPSEDASVSVSASRTIDAPALTEMNPKSWTKNFWGSLCISTIH